MDPRGTVISEWLNIEEKLIEILDKYTDIDAFPTKKSSRRSPVLIMNELRKNRYLSDYESELLQDLRRMRNDVAYQFDLNLTEKR